MNTTVLAKKHKDCPISRLPFDTLVDIFDIATYRPLHPAALSLRHPRHGFSPTCVLLGVKWCYPLLSFGPPSSSPPLYPNALQKSWQNICGDLSVTASE
ncbi:hypothetical protein BDZ89DRAFT_1145913 [Hymenopellis radicata]|nr:hypothetical protein BDZ89DRAFT_1145913 [Hymenopellis radicata]